MQQRSVYLIAMALVSLMMATMTVSAQPGMRWQGSGGWGAGSHYGRMYDLKTVETVEGTLVKVDRMTPRRGMSYGVHMTVQTATETVSVHLGPGWYIEKQDIKLEPRDTVVVRGSWVTFDGKPVLLAAEVTKGEETLKLRDDSGLPMWSGWRRR